MTSVSLRSSYPSSSSRLSIDEVQQLQRAYGHWWSLRMTCMPLFQDLLNAKSKLSYVQQKGGGSIFTTSASLAPKATKIYDEISDITNAIESIHGQMKEELTSIAELLMGEKWEYALMQQEHEIKRSSQHFEFSLFQNLLGPINDQTLLESSILDSLRSNIYSGEKDQDLSTTFIACMEYPPYLSRDEIRLLIGLNTKDEEQRERST